MARKRLGAAETGCNTEMKEGSGQMESKLRLADNPARWENRR